MNIINRIIAKIHSSFSTVIGIQDDKRTEKITRDALNQYKDALIRLGNT